MPKDFSRYEVVDAAPKSAGSQYEIVPDDQSGLTPDFALPESPVGAFDRAKLALGNERGNVEYLKRKFQDVKVHPEKGVVVKDKGIWKQLDPSVFKDPWSASEALADVIEGAANIGAQMAGQAYGAAKGAVAGAAVGSAVPGLGTAAGAVAGGIAGAAAGGAGGETVRTFLGRIVGTYSATPEEQLQDIGLEGLAAAAGQGLAVAAKPSWQWFRGVMKKVGDGASEGTKSALAAVYGNLTGAGADATRLMFDNIDDVTKQVVSFKTAGAKNSKDIIRMGAESQVAMMDDLLEKATKALPDKYGKLLNDFMASGQAKNLTVKVGDVANTAKQAIADAGFGTIDNLGHLRPLTPAQIAQRLTNGEDVEIGKDAFKAVKEVVNALNTFSKVGELQGAKAVKALTKMNSVLNRVHQDAIGNGTDRQLARAVGQAVAGFKRGLGEQFKNAGLSAEYTKLSDLYKTYGDVVTLARETLARDGSEGLVKKLLESATSAGKQVKARGQVGLLAELAGADGEKLFKDIVVTEATKRFAPIMPKLGFLQSGAAGAAYLGGVSLTGAAAVGTQFSPAIVRKQAQAAKYLLPTVSYLKSLPPKGIDLFLQDPRISGAVFSQAMQSMQDEDAMTEQMLKQGGVINGQ